MLHIIKNGRVYKLRELNGVPVLEDIGSIQTVKVSEMEKGAQMHVFEIGSMQVAIESTK